MASNGSGIRVVAFDEQQKLPAPIRNATIETVEVFQALPPCLSFIEQQKNDGRVIIVISTSTEETSLNMFERSASVEAIIVVTTANADIDTFPSKVIGVFSETEGVLRALTEAFDDIELRLNASSFLFGHHMDGTDNLAFYFYHLWKNYAEDEKRTKKDLVDEGRVIFRSNNQIKAHITQFETAYRPNEVYTWFDKRRSPFPYHVLISHALRSRNLEVLSLSRFFLDDLSKQMKPAPSGGSYKQLCYGTKLPIAIIEQLEQKAKKDMIAFQCFLSVTQSRATGLAEATRPTRRQNLMNVLFKIDLNNTQCIISEETILIDMATPFQIVCVTRSSDNTIGQQTLVVIKLTALNKTEKDRFIDEFVQRQLTLGRPIKYLLQRMNGEISDDEALADEHISRKECTQAANILARIPNPNARILNKHGCLLRDHLHDYDNAIHYHRKAISKSTNRERAEGLIYLGLAYKSKKQHTDAYKTYSEALEWFENEKKRDPGMIARCLTGLGVAQWGLKNLDEALDYIERALAIREHEIKPKDDFDVAGCLGNMSNILHDQGDVERALSCATRAADILSKCGKNDPRLTAALNNLGAMHRANGDMVKAREFFQRALDSISNEDHPYRKSTLANIALMDSLEKSKK